MDREFELLSAKVADLRRNDAGGFKFAAVTWADDDLLLDVDVYESDRWHPGPPNRQVERWRIRCRDAREPRIGTVPSRGSIVLEENHTALLPYLFPVTELYFRGACPDVDRVIGQLLRAHADAVGDWFAFNRFLNQCAGRPADLANLLSGGFGRLAAGPREVMDRYADVLRHNGLEVSSPPPIEPEWRTRRRRGETVIETEPPRVLLLGNTAVVTPQVTAKRV